MSNKTVRALFAFCLLAAVSLCAGLVEEEFAVGENSLLSIRCPASHCVSSLSKASYGSPTSQECSSSPDQESCPSPCHAPNSMSVVSLLCLGKPSCDVYVSNVVFGGDPCHGVFKLLTISAACGPCDAAVAQQPSSSSSSSSPPPSSLPPPAESLTSVGLGISDWSRLKKAKTGRVLLTSGPPSSSAEFSSSSFSSSPPRGLELCEDETLEIQDWGNEAVTCGEFLSRLSGTSFTCEAYFCPTCPQPGMCDRTCGYCSSSPRPPPPLVLPPSSSSCPSEGATLDCQRRCLLPRHCFLSSLGYETCASWVGNGMCDAGDAYTSDAGVKPDFSCKTFGFDDGDCEAPAREDGGPSAGAAARPPCRDLPFSRDGELRDCREALGEEGGGGMSCLRDFCDDCEFAGACDKSCGVCSAPDDGVGGGGGALHSSWQPVLQQRHGVEGQSAHADGWCVVLTASIAPSQSMTNTKRWAPNLRRREYEASIRGWVTELQAMGYDRPEDGGEQPLAFIIFAESSRGNLESLRREVPLSLQHHFEFLSFRHPEVPIMRGKGHAEYLSIKHAVENSLLVQQHCSHVVKVTGRYAIKNLLRILGEYHTDKTDLVLQSSPPTWQIHDGVVRSEVVGFRKELVDYLFSGQSESQGRPMEYLLRKRAEDLERTAGRNVSFFEKLEIWNGGKVMDGSGRKIKNL